jgi:hypothetical protein
MTETQKRVALAPEDGIRMRRLSEEISARIYEMALIFARTTDLTLGPEMTLKFAPRKKAAEEAHLPPGPPVDVDIEIFDLSDGTHCCYDYISQVCVCPC